MARALGKGLVSAAIVFFVLLAILQVLFPIRERFTTLYGAKSNKPKGSFCEFNAECASDMCAHFTNAEGKHHTCL
jgi:hypothetical protein